MPQRYVSERLMLRHSLAEVQGLRIHPAELCRGSRVHVKAWWDAAGRAFAALQTQGVGWDSGMDIADLGAGWRPCPEGVWTAVQERLQRITAALLCYAIGCLCRRLLCLRLIVCKTTPPHFCKTYLPLTQSQAQRAVMRYPAATVESTRQAAKELSRKG